MSSNATGETAEGDDASSERFQRPALVEDARELVKVVESIHPDPYRGYGGRVALHRRLEETVRDLPGTATREEFYRRAAPLVAGMDDVHSQLRPPDRNVAEQRRLPLSLRIVGERLYVGSVADESMQGLLGAQVVEIEGEPIDALAARGARLRGAENRYTALSYASRLIEEYHPLDRLLSRREPPAEPTIGFRVDGDERRRPIAPVAGDAGPTDELAPTIEQPRGSGPRYRLYEGGEAAVFHPGDLSYYRESLESMAGKGAAVADEFAPAAYETLVGGDPPDDLDDLIAELPSMIETLTALVREMAAAETRALIVDLRDNPGGDSRFLNHVAYVLDGWDGVVRASRSTRAVKRRTDAHRDRYGSAEIPVETAEANPADYDFGMEFVLRDADRDRLRALTRDRLARSETFAAEAADGTHEAYYRPERLIVVTSAGTMSSAFAAATQLRAVGAEVVGVPSGQAPVSFGEPVERTLTNTGLTARIAGSMYDWLPDHDGDLVPMDRELTPDRFERYDRAADAGLRLAFDYAGVTDGDRPEPT